MVHENLIIIQIQKGKEIELSSSINRILVWISFIITIITDIIVINNTNNLFNSSFWRFIFPVCMLIALNYFSFWQFYYISDSTLTQGKLKIRKPFRNEITISLDEIIEIKQFTLGRVNYTIVKYNHLKNIEKALILNIGANSFIFEEEEIAADIIIIAKNYYKSLK